MCDTLSVIRALLLPRSFSIHDVRTTCPAEIINKNTVGATASDFSEDAIAVGLYVKI